VQSSEITNNYIIPNHSFYPNPMFHVSYQRVHNRKVWVTWTSNLRKGVIGSKAFARFADATANTIVSRNTRIIPETVQHANVVHHRCATNNYHVFVLPAYRGDSLFTSRSCTISINEPR
jgi:hypothetical protein